MPERRQSRGKQDGKHKAKCPPWCGGPQSPQSLSTPDSTWRPPVNGWTPGELQPDIESTSHTLPRTSFSLVWLQKGLTAQTPLETEICSSCFSHRAPHYLQSGAGPAPHTSLGWLIAEFLHPKPTQGWCWGCDQEGEPRLSHHRETRVPLLNEWNFRQQFSQSCSTESVLKQFLLHKLPFHSPNGWGSFLKPLK